MQTQSYMVAAHTAFTRPFKPVLPFPATNTAGIIAAAIISVLLILILIAIILFCCCRARHRKKYEKEICNEIRYTHRNTSVTWLTDTQSPVAVGKLSCLNTGCVQKDCFQIHVIITLKSNHNLCFSDQLPLCLTLFVCLSFSL